MSNETASLFQRLTRGRYVIGVAHEAQRDVLAASSVMQVSNRPLLLAVVVNPRHVSYPLMRSGRLFAVSVLKHDQVDSARFGATQSECNAGDCDGISWYCGRDGVPIVDDALAHFECEMSAVMPAGDHEIVLGRVVDSRISDGRDAMRPFTYAANTDRRVIFPASAL